MELQTFDESRIDVHTFILEYAYNCEVVYTNRLFQEWCLDEIIDYMIDASFLLNFFGDFDENGRYIIWILKFDN